MANSAVAEEVPPQDAAAAAAAAAGENGAVDESKLTKQQRQMLQQQRQAEAIAKMQAGPTALGDYFRWRPLPWWLIFLFGMFLLTKFQIVYNDSACAVLGTASPVAASEVNKAFRTLSMCTHPDRLRGRLKREPTRAELRRGEIIFNRASAAKDDLLKVLKLGKKKSIACYQGELELALWAFIMQAGVGLAQLGIWDYVEMCKDLIYGIVTFESGFFSTILSCLWLSFLARVVLSFLGYLWKIGIIRNFLGVVTTIIIGPIPTVLNFVFLPVCRVLVFLNSIRQGGKVDTDSLPPAPPIGTDDAPPDEHELAARAQKAAAAVQAEELTPAERLRAKARNTEDMPKGIRQRKKKETDTERQAKNEALQAGPTAESDAAVIANMARPDPSRAWGVVSFTHSEPLKARAEAAKACQFDLLLILTKPIIPLIMMISMGQVWNGLFSSLIIGHILKKWVPQMSYEGHHLLCFLFGALHTLLGVSASQVEDFSNREGVHLLHLRWAWSLKDVLMVMYMNMHGSLVSAMTQLGNEPSFSASFASGIAVRIALAQDGVQGLPLMRTIAGLMERGMREYAGIVLDASEEVVAYSGGGIGDCAGGAFRMLLWGDTPYALWGSRIIKLWLMLMPALGAAQWLQRTYQAGKMLGKKNKLTRFIQRLILCIMGIVQCILLCRVELNASNGALINFWVAMLFGCIGESLLSIYEIRLPPSVKQIMFLLVFLLI